MTKQTLPLRPAALIGAAALAFLAAAPAAAQDSERRPMIVTAGIGPQIVPDYPGADSYSLQPFFVGGFRREGAPLPFEAPGDGLGITLLPRSSMINFGPAVEFVNKRRERDVGAPVGEVDFTVEAGGFVQIFPARNFRLRAELRQALNGHDGLVADFGADFVVRNEQQYVFSIGPRARWGDNDYHAAYYGVTPAVATATGLPVYSAGSGFYSVGAAAGILYRLGRNWGVAGYAGYDRLVGDAADSPIVRAFGSRDQFSAGAGLWIEFRVGGGRSR